MEYVHGRDRCKVTVIDISAIIFYSEVITGFKTPYN